MIAMGLNMHALSVCDFSRKYTCIYIYLIVYRRFMFMWYVGYCISESKLMGLYRGVIYDMLLRITFKLYIIYFLDNFRVIFPKLENHACKPSLKLVRN